MLASASIGHEPAVLGSVLGADVAPALFRHARQQIGADLADHRLVAGDAPLGQQGCERAAIRGVLGRIEMERWPPVVKAAGAKVDN